MENLLTDPVVGRPDIPQAAQVPTPVWGPKTKHIVDVLLDQGDMEAMRVHDPDQAGADLLESERCVQIDPTKAFPWYAVCQISQETAKGHTVVASGFAVNWGEEIGVVLMTAAHVLQFSDRIVVTPGLNGMDDPYGSFEVSSSDWFYPENWQSDHADDWAVIRIPMSIFLPAFGTAIFGSDDDLTNRAVALSGYPKPNPTKNELPTLWCSGGTIFKVASGKVFYSLKTEIGQSGSPTWTFVTEFEPFLSIGVHGWSKSPNFPPYGVLWRKEIRDQIAVWLSGGL